MSTPNQEYGGAMNEKRCRPDHPYAARTFRGMDAPAVPAPRWLLWAGAAAVIVLAAAMLAWAVLD